MNIASRTSKVELGDRTRLEFTKGIPLLKKVFLMFPTKRSKVTIKGLLSSFCSLFHIVVVQRRESPHILAQHTGTTSYVGPPNFHGDLHGSHITEKEAFQMSGLHFLFTCARLQG